MREGFRSASRDLDRWRTTKMTSPSSPASDMAAVGMYIDLTSCVMSQPPGQLGPSPVIAQKNMKTWLFFNVQSACVDPASGACQLYDVTAWGSVGQRGAAWGSSPGPRPHLHEQCIRLHGEMGGGR